MADLEELQSSEQGSEMRECIIPQHAKTLPSSNVIPSANKMLIVWIVVEMIKIAGKLFSVSLIQFLNPRLIL
jgi:hypothetical protein